MTGQVDRSIALEWYRERKPLYSDYAERVRSLLADLSSSLKVHVITARAKDEVSFQKKSLRLKGDGILYRYDDPCLEVEDLAGARVICFAESQVSQVCKLIEDNFHIHEQIDKAKELSSIGRVGYVSRHFIVSVTDDRCRLPEYAKFSGLKAEIQVRTVFQHAWAEVEHRLQYKDDTPKLELRARFQALSGLVQIADREFEQLFELDKKISQAVKDVVGEEAAADYSLFDEENADDEQHNHALTRASNLFGLSPRALVSAGEYEKAIRTYDGLISLQPKQSWHYVGRARAHLLAGNVSAAESDIAKIENIASKDSRLVTILRKLKAGISAVS